MNELRFVLFTYITETPTKLLCLDSWSCVIFILWYCERWSIVTWWDICTTDISLQKSSHLASNNKSAANSTIWLSSQKGKLRWLNAKWIDFNINWFNLIILNNDKALFSNSPRFFTDHFQKISHITIYAFESADSIYGSQKFQIILDFIILWLHKKFPLFSHLIFFEKLCIAKTYFVWNPCTIYKISMDKEIRVDI